MMELSSAPVVMTKIEGSKTGVLLQEGCFLRLATREKQMVSVDTLSTGEQMVQ